MTLSLRSKICLWAILLGAWLAQSFAFRAPLDADAISYLDIAYSCVSGNWHALVNGYWSPGFPFLLALWIKLFHVLPAREPLAIHLFAFASLVAALVVFERFLSTLLSVLAGDSNETGNSRSNLPTVAIQLLGYGLFIWVSTFLTPPYLEQPDILVLILYLWASSLALRLVFSNQPSWRFAEFGLILGLAYLVKVVMFPLSFVFLATIVPGAARARRIPAILLSIAAFLAVSAPFIFALSQSKGRLTYGDAGIINYRHVTGQDSPTPPANSPGQLPTFAAPHIAEYVYKAQLGTYPPWADPSFDYKGELTRFSLRRQLNRTHIVLNSYFELYFLKLAAVLAGLAAVLLCAYSFKESLNRFLRLFPLWLPAIAGLTIYALVRVEGRMLAGITIVLFLSFFAAVRIEKTEAACRCVRNIALAVFLVLVAQAAFQAAHETIVLTTANSFPDWQVAAALHESGLAAGDRVSYMGDALTDHAWAHLARVILVAEIPQQDVPDFWAASAPDREIALQWLAATGAKALVTRGVPHTAMAMGWKEVGDTDYYLLPLRNTVKPGSP